MTKHAASLATLLVAALILPAQKGILREEEQVTVGSTTERWRLEWQTAPKPACATDEAGMGTCPCTGFEPGELGRLDLVRSSPASPTDRLPLTPLFADQENPGTQAGLTAATLARSPAKAMN